MQRISTYGPFLILLICAALFIGVSSLSLPERVASHFVASGVANGFMPRTFYVRFMLFFALVLPSGLMLLTNLTLRASEARMNLPHREYWLAPERRDETIEYLRQQNVRISFILTVFLCYVHWLVERANELTPPHLSSLGIIGGLVVLLVFIVIWAIKFFGHFLKIPR